MTAWQPPIPKGALVEARALGAGLALLGYCYDIVKAEDGLIEINLHELYPLLDTSYASIRRWWGMMQELGIIGRVEERGRKGVRAYFNPEWIDRRQMKTRSETSSSMSTFQETSSPVSANTRETRSETSSPVSANGSAYKVLMDSDQAGGGKDQDGTAHSPPHPAVLAYRQAFPHIRLTQKQEAIISALVGERVEHLECWREVVQDYELSTIWRPENIGNMRSRFEKKLKEKSTPRNGQRPAEERPPLPQVKPSTPRNANTPTESARKILELRKQKP